LNTTIKTKDKSKKTKVKKTKDKKVAG